MSDTLTTILGLLAEQTKNPARAPDFAAELSKPETMSRVTYASLTLLLVDNQTRELIGWPTLILAPEVRADLKVILRKAEFIWVNGSGVVKKRPLDEQSPAKDGGKNTKGKPAGKNANKKPEPVTSLTDKIIVQVNLLPETTDAARRLHDRGCRNPKTMAKNTADSLLQLRIKLRGLHSSDIETNMLVSGIDSMIEKSPWAVAGNGLSIVSAK